MRYDSLPVVGFSDSDSVAGTARKSAEYHRQRAHFECPRWTF